MINYKKIRVPIYHCTLTLIVSMDAKEIEKIAKFGRDWNLKGAEDGFGAITFPHHDNKSNIFIAFDKDYKDADVACHEAVHACNLIFEATCIELDSKNDEPQAYLTAWIFNEIHKWFISLDKK